MCANSGLFCSFSSLAINTNAHHPTKHKWVYEAIKCSEIKQLQGWHISREIAYHLLVECTKQQDLELCRRMQALMLYNALDSFAPLANHIIRLFATCGSCAEAHQAFTKVSNPDHYTWNALINVQAKIGGSDLALPFYEKMQHSGGRPDKYTFVSISKACGNLGAIEQGRYIHIEVAVNGLQSDVIVGTSLVDMYVKCGSLEEARTVFDSLSSRNVVSWGAIIAGYAQHGYVQLALEFFQDMQDEGIKPNTVFFLTILKACSNVGAIHHGRWVNEQVIEEGLQSDVLVGSTIVDMYVKCGSLDEADRVFDKLEKRTAICWDTLIVGYAQHGEGHLVLEAFGTMQEEGIELSKITFLSVLKASGILGGLMQGRIFHEQILGSEHQFDSSVGNALLGMYAKCRSLEEAYRVFIRLPNQDVVSWNVLIGGLVLDNRSFHTLEYLVCMEQCGIKPDRITYLSMLRACGSEANLEQGRCIHEQVYDKGLHLYNCLQNTLMDMYVKCGSLKEACRMFDRLQNRDAVSWNVIIAGYSKPGRGRIVLDMFEEMQFENIVPDKITFLSMLSAWNKKEDIRHARCIHAWTIEDGLESDITLGNGLVDLYAKCESLEEAQRVFNRLPNRDIVSWNAIIEGYAETNKSDFAFEYYDALQIEGAEPSKATFLSLLKVCGTAEQRRHVHENILESELQTDIVVGNSLMFMYVKSGRLWEANKVFNCMPKHDVISWTTMIAGYGQFGEAGTSVYLFEEMQYNAIKADDVVFVGILTAFSNAGLVEEGMWYFRSMKQWHGIQMNAMHMDCMVDLLGRAGFLREAENLLYALEN